MAWVRTARQLSPEAQGSLLMLLVRFATPGGWGYDIRWVVGRLNSRAYIVTDEDAVYALHTAAAVPDDWYAGAVMSTALAMAVRARPGTSEDLRSAIATLSQSVGPRQHLAIPDRSKLKRELVKLMPPKESGEVIDTSPITARDGWSAAVLRELSGWQGTTAAAGELILHLATAAGSKPAKAWLAQTGQLTGDADAVRVVKLLVETLVTAPGITDASPWGGGNVNLLVSDHNADVVRAAAWAAGTIAQPWVVPSLQAAAYRAIHSTGLADYVASPKVPNACVYSLGAIASADAIAALQYLQRTTKDAGYRKQIMAALTNAAARSGLTPGQMIERAVPEAGLNSGSERNIPLTATASARVRVMADCRIITDWSSGDGWVQRDPSGAGPNGYPAVRGAVKEVKDALTGERNRLESLLADDRRWPAGEWRRLYLAHPVTGQLARRLLWTLEDGTGTVTGMPADGGRLLTLDGHSDIPPDATAWLWHPARAATEEVRLWRDRLVQDEFIQPFKQVYREVYLLTPAERETRLYSNRFAAHILRYRQTFALMKQRNWTTNFLGSHDGGYDGHARHEFADAGLTAVFDHYAADSGGPHADVELCSTDRVFFYRTGDRSRDPVPLEDVPDLVFSEAMRDVDLFVGVTSIALDPDWADRGEDPHIYYWQAFSFGELTETASVRRDALARLIPKLKIADRLELDDRFLRVRGRLHTYKIHIGSANIQIEPDNRYLCIVPSGGGRSRVMLPFEGDQVLSVILSKAVLLAADDKITDSTILQQLRHRQ